MTYGRRRVSVAVRANEAHQCSVVGCGQHRTGLTRWCSRHAATAERQGHPLGRPVRPHQWAAQRQAVARLYRANLGTHPGLEKALQWVSRLMAEAVTLDGQQPWASELARVHRHGASPLDVLTELTSAWCYLQQAPHACVSDKHRDYTVSRAILAMAPRPRTFTQSGSYAKQPRAAALEHLGPLMVRSLAPLLANTLRSIETEDQQARAEVDAMRAPFTPSNQAFERAAAEALNESKAPTP